MNKMLNNSGDEFTILKEYSKHIGNRVCVMWLIQFTNTGYTKEVYKNNAKKGKAKDPYEPSIQSKGYEGESNKNLTYYKTARRLWSNMIKRCYDPNYDSGYYGRGYSVSDRWLCFANFLEDVSELDNFDKWLLGFEDQYPRYNLDKDLKVKGNKVYCKACCSFVLESINKSEGAKNGKPFTKKPRPNKVGKS